MLLRAVISFAFPDAARAKAFYARCWRDHLCLFTGNGYSDYLSPHRRKTRLARRARADTVFAAIFVATSTTIPFHTIEGDRGRGDAPNSSDGVVPYWSSHLDGAQSELIVPSDDRAQRNPKAIAEVSRILKLHRE